QSPKCFLTCSRCLHRWAAYPACLFYHFVWSNQPRSDVHSTGTILVDQESAIFIALPLQSPELLLDISLPDLDLGDLISQFTVFLGEAVVHLLKILELDEFLVVQLLLFCHKN